MPLHITPGLPRLERDDTQRYWMPPAVATEVAGLWGDDKDHRKFFENLVGRGLIPFRRSSPKLTAPKLHSLEGAIRAICGWHVVRAGHGYDAASDVGDRAQALMFKIIDENEYLQHIERHSIGYVISDRGADTRVFKNSDSIDDIYSLSHSVVSVLPASDLIKECFHRYAEAWDPQVRVTGNSEKGAWP
jgi:hypothetical protein